MLTYIETVDEMRVSHGVIKGAEMYDIQNVFA